MKIYYNPNLKKFSRDLRNNSTLGEVLLWNELKRKKMMGYQFMRQKPITNYIVDFFCSKLKLIIEVDGSSHDDKMEQDLIRQNNLENLGLSFLRFSDYMVKTDMQNVIRGIENYIHEFELKINSSQTTP